MSTVHSRPAQLQQQRPSRCYTLSRGVLMLLKARALVQPWAHECSFCQYSQHHGLPHPFLSTNCSTSANITMACPIFPLLQASWTALPSTRPWTSSVLHSRARRSPGGGACRITITSPEAWGSDSLGLGVLVERYWLQLLGGEVLACPDCLVWLTQACRRTTQFSWGSWSMGLLLGRLGRTNALQHRQPHCAARQKSFQADCL